MNSRLMVGILGLGLSTAISGLAGAADLPNRKVAPVAFAPTTAASWTGIYLGVQAGVGMSAAEIKLPGGTGGLDGLMGRGLFGGVRLGVDYQVSPNVVLGLIGTADFGDIGGKAKLGSETFSQEALRIDGNKFVGPADQTVGPYPGTLTYTADGGVRVRTTDVLGLRARLGYLVTPDTLVYIAPGWASAKGTLKGNLGTITMVDSTGGSMTDVYNASFRQSKRINGWQLGVGFESRLTDNLSANFEYVYSQFQDLRIGGSDVKASAATGAFTAGLNYRFGVNAGAAPVRVAAAAPENWTGLYAGLSGGAGIGGAKLKLGNMASVDGFGSVGLAGGVVLGYDYQIAPRWVIGAEFGGDLSSYDVSARETGANAGAKISMPWAITARARAGYLISPGTMLFASLGVTGGQFRVKADNAGFGIRESSSSYGAMVGIGGGFQTAMSKNVFLRMEYQHSMLPAIKVKSIGSVPVSFEPTAGAARISLIYKM
ncbi:MAG TPA: outer membrane beta-barrel protein [Beijerinckiaceae bacterium]|nr:outer membrane beta-barrel protein [Beijerinckiaceae bacterium]